jgi:acetoin utilization deacetylase AcuC-like enzyme
MLHPSLNAHSEGFTMNDIANFTLQNSAQRHLECTADKQPIPVFYSPSMVADAASFSPSAGKPALVVESWKALAVPIELRVPQPVSVEQFSLAHDPKFVADVLYGRRENGFGNRLPAVAATLPYTSGVMLSAAREALNNHQGTVAPCSGFHHAGYDFAGGFCTFNGLMVTVAVLLAEGLVSKVGILDCDQHWGNGTNDIIDRLHLQEQVVHYGPTREFGTPARAEAFLANIQQILDRFRDCDLVLYQAGADPHIDDPLGGWLTTVQLYQRDRAVLMGLRLLGIPVAWNLAGGYQRDENDSIRPVLDIHDNTLLAFAEAYADATRIDMTCQERPEEVMRSAATC